MGVARLRQPSSSPLAWQFPFRCSSVAAASCRSPPSACSASCRRAEQDCFHRRSGPLVLPDHFQHLLPLPASAWRPLTWPPKRWKLEADEARRKKETPAVRLSVGDEVVAITGDHKGESGKILKIWNKHPMDQ